MTLMQKRKCFISKASNQTQLNRHYRKVSFSTTEEQYSNIQKYYIINRFKLEQTYIWKNNLSEVNPSVLDLKLPFFRFLVQFCVLCLMCHLQSKAARTGKIRILKMRRKPRVSDHFLRVLFQSCCLIIPSFLRLSFFLWGRIKLIGLGYSQTRRNYIKLNENSWQEFSICCWMLRVVTTIWMPSSTLPLQQNLTQSSSPLLSEPSLPEFSLFQNQRQHHCGIRYSYCPFTFPFTLYINLINICCLTHQLFVYIQDKDYDSFIFVSPVSHLVPGPQDILNIG